MSKTEYTYSIKVKEKKTRRQWLEMLPEPYNVKAINAIRYVKKDEAEAYLNVVRSGHSSVSVFMESILFKDTIEKQDFWIDAMYKIEGKMLKF